MKLISILLLSIFSVTNFQTESYYIIKLKGEIYNQTSGKFLKQGDAIKADDKLKFEQKSAMALVLSDTRGRFTLKCPENVDESVDGLIVFVKSALIGSQQNQLSTRSVATQSAIGHLDKYFGNDDFNVIGEESTVRLSKKSYPTYKGCKIVATYNIGENNFRKNISTKNQKMFLSRSTFDLPAGEESLIEGVEIYKTNVSTNDENLITTANIRFIDKNELEKEFMTIINKFNDEQITKSKLRALIINYFTEFYGKTDELYLNEFVNQLIIDNVK